MGRTHLGSLFQSNAHEWDWQIFIFASPTTVLLPHNRNRITKSSFVPRQACRQGTSPPARQANLKTPESPEEKFTEGMLGCWGYSFLLVKRSVWLKFDWTVLFGLLLVKLHTAYTFMQATTVSSSKYIKIMFTSLSIRAFRAFVPSRVPSILTSRLRVVSVLHVSICLRFDVSSWGRETGPHARSDGGRELDATHASRGKELDSSECGTKSSLNRKCFANRNEIAVKLHQVGARTNHMLLYLTTEQRMHKDHPGSSPMSTEKSNFQSRRVSRWWTNQELQGAQEAGLTKCKVCAIHCQPQNTNFEKSQSFSDSNLSIFSNISAIFSVFKSSSIKMTYI